VVQIIYQKIIYREDLQANPDVFYIFGDNDQRKGFGGQAKEMRGEPNAIGIRTKKSPDMQLASFYSDDEYAENCRKILEDLEIITELLDDGQIVVFPLDGIGIGLSDMSNKCPKTFKFLQTKIRGL
jgi:hypothetical protein